MPCKHMPLCLCYFQPASYTIFKIKDISNRSPHHYNMHTQQKMQSTKVQQPWLWFARVSVSITKSVCGHLTWLSHVTHCTQCLMRKNVHYMHRLPMSFGWQKRLIWYRLCVKKAVSTCHVACSYRQVAVAQLLFWFYFGDSLFYEASDLCRLATATSFIVNMFTT